MKTKIELRRAKPKTYRQAPTHWLKFYEEAVIESEALNVWVFAFNFDQFNVICMTWMLCMV